MGELERLVESIEPDKTAKDFRLWLTSMPTPAFPVSVLQVRHGASRGGWAGPMCDRAAREGGPALIAACRIVCVVSRTQNGVKMTNEPPRGLKQNLRSFFYRLNDESLSLTGKPTEFRKLLFGTSNSAACAVAGRCATSPRLAYRPCVHAVLVRRAGVLPCHRPGAQEVWGSRVEQAVRVQREVRAAARALVVWSVVCPGVQRAHLLPARVGRAGRFCSDLDISRRQLELYLDEYEEVPYRVLNFLTSYINYGGRVTDDKDLRTIDVILKVR